MLEIQSPIATHKADDILSLGQYAPRTKAYGIDTPFKQYASSITRSARRLDHKPYALHVARHFEILVNIYKR